MNFMKWTVLGACLMTAGSALAETSPYPYDGTGSQWPVLPGVPAPLAAEPKPIKPPAPNAWPAEIRNYAIKLQQGRPGLPADPAGALDYYEQAADKGDPYGRQKMCVAYLLGEGRPVNAAKGSGYCAKLNDTDPVKVFGGAFDYDHGLSGPKDEAAALSLYQDAAKGSNGDAMDIIGAKVLRDHPEKAAVARSWYRHAAMEGSADGMDHLAAMVEAGQGGPADADEAYWLYVNAARRGNVHAKAWLAQHPSLTPLRRVQVFKALGEPQSLISVPVTDASGTRMVPLVWEDIKKRNDLLYPKSAAEDEQEGYANVHCYIRGDQHVDICLVQQEAPLGYGFGAGIQALFNTDVVIATKDIKDQPTAHAVFGFSAGWQVSNIRDNFGY